VLDGLAVLWPLILSDLPRCAAADAPPPAPPVSTELDALVREILQHPLARHWPELKELLVKDLLQNLRHRPNSLPAWHLPALFDLAAERPALWPELRRVLPPAQLDLLQLRPDWRALDLPIPAPPSSETLEQVLQDKAQPLERRRAALVELATRPGSRYAKYFARLARAIVDSNFTGLPPDRRLPPELLPEFPSGLKLRDIRLERAFALLSLVPVDAWFARRQSGKRFLQGILACEHFAPLVYALAQSWKRFGAGKRLLEILHLYEVAQAREILELVAPLANSPTPPDAKFISKYLDVKHKQIAPQSPILDLLLSAPELPETVFVPLARSILNGITASGGTSLRQALLRIALIVNPLPTEHSLENVGHTATAAWREAHSLLLFRRRIQDAGQRTDTDEVAM
jgi:hypothetical protein